VLSSESGALLFPKPAKRLAINWPVAAVFFRIVILFVSSALLVSCGPSVPTVTRLEVSPVSGKVDLSTALSGNWDRVCMLAPYSTNEHAMTVLGAPVDIESKSDINSLDSITLLVTMKRDGVTGLFEVPRKNADFTPLGGKCYFRGDSMFEVPAQGHPFATKITD
jgi:hypothetical protein